jgi:predicted TIM-barrel fold metal-dependent hydrolase
MTVTTGPTEADIAESDGAAPSRPLTIDCDVHPTPHDFDEFLAYVPDPWRSREKMAFSTRGEGGPSAYYVPGGSTRKEAIPKNGGPAASDPYLTAEQLLSGIGVDVAMLLSLVARPVANPKHEAALSEGSNRWLQERWLEGEFGDRFRGAIRVCADAPDLAVAEIKRAHAASDRFNQVLVVPNVLKPLGHEPYMPIYEAAAERGLPVCMHLTRPAGMTLGTPVGFPQHFVEVQPMYALLYATHLVSMIFNGVFERYPDLRVVYVEGGIAWLPALMRRMDRNWEDLRSEVPWVKKPPSEYAAAQAFFTTQPIEEPLEGPAALMDVFAGAEHLLSRNILFSTDYPHWDADEPRWVLRQFPAEYHDAIRGKNAAALYNL